MLSSSTNVFLPVQLCARSGLLLGSSGTTETDVVCGALLPVECDATGNFNQLPEALTRAKRSFHLVGFLIVKDDRVDLDGLLAIPFDFIVHLDFEARVHASFACHPKRDALVVFYDARTVADLYEGDVHRLLGTSWLNTAQVLEVEKDASVVRAVPENSSRNIERSSPWRIVLLIAAIVHRMNYLLHRTTAKWLIELSDRVVETSSTGLLVRGRLRGLTELAEGFDGRGHIALPSRNLVFGLLADWLFGLALTLALRWYGPVPWASLGWAQTVVANLRSLVRWLMGAPAGLKLNAQLSSALGHFFLYHITLWETYVSVVWPWVSPLLCPRFVGFRIQLSLASDLLSLATLHVYCFYGYAGRLYWAWVRALGALGRQGRARKWNPLRQRTDSYRCAASERLFLGTLLFAVLLFLFPTVALYYAVFLTLRLAVLAVQSALQRTSELWDALPWYTIASRSLGSGPVVGDVHFEVLAGGPKTALFMKVEPAALALCRPVLRCPPWKSLARDMLLGNLLYPV